MSKEREALLDPLFNNNPIALQVLGICSALAVTTKMETALVMSGAVLFVLFFSNVSVSVIRNMIPPSIRIIVQLTIIASLVIITDQVLKAFVYDISKQLSVFVGLIITNCIIMGRAEAFASQNKPWASLLDGLACGLGYSFILITIACVREPLGFGTFLGHPLPAIDIWWHSWTIMVMPPGAFFMLAIVTWIARNLSAEKAETK